MNRNAVPHYAAALGASHKRGNTKMPKVESSRGKIWMCLSGLIAAGSIQCVSTSNQKSAPADKPKPEYAPKPLTAQTSDVSRTHTPVPMTQAALTPTYAYENGQPQRKSDRKVTLLLSALGTDQSAGLDPPEGMLTPGESTVCFGGEPVHQCSRKNDPEPCYPCEDQVTGGHTDTCTPIPDGEALFCVELTEQCVNCCRARKTNPNESTECTNDCICQNMRFPPPAEAGTAAAKSDN